MPGDPVLHFLADPLHVRGGILYVGVTGNLVLIGIGVTDAPFGTAELLKILMLNQNTLIANIAQVTVTNFDRTVADVGQVFMAHLVFRQAGL